MYRCPECGSIPNQYRTPVGPMWCEQCGFRVEEKTALPNPFIEAALEYSYSTIGHSGGVENTRRGIHYVVTVQRKVMIGDGVNHRTEDILVVECSEVDTAKIFNACTLVNDAKSEVTMENNAA